MNVIERIDDLRQTVTQARCSGQSIGFVPTMGGLHAGHLRLVAQARRECDLVVVSVFVNPLQFGPTEDFASYPRPFERDASLAQEAGCDVLFHPSVEEMYGQAGQSGAGTGVLTSVAVAQLSEPMCGAYRPGFFAGVATVVAKLFAICDADRAYFGMKDYQQLLVVRQMAHDLSFRTEVVGVPTQRAHNGLALSSRNEYLSVDDREREAEIIYVALMGGAQTIVDGERHAKALRAKIDDVLVGVERFDVEYLEIRDAETLAELDLLSGPVLIALAVWVGSGSQRARLIDNIVLHIDDDTGRVDVEAGEIVEEYPA